MRISIIATVVLSTFSIVPAIPIDASPVDHAAAVRVAERTVTERGSGQTIRTISTISPGDETLGFIAELDPVGFVIISGDTDLPPVIAYSFRDQIPSRQPELGVFLGILWSDLGRRLDSRLSLPEPRLEERQSEWLRLLGTDDDRDGRGFQQWPAAGTTSTGGWLETNWHQGSPYNDQCPLDPVAGGRCVAGCPSVAVAMVINYHRTTNDTQLDDGDDYYHSYAGRQYWIDDDWAAQDFPSFPTLSASLTDLENRYRQGLAATDADAAALVFAAGVAATQVYTASISGTFGVGQAVDAYHRFGADGLSLVLGTDPEIYDRMSDNMKRGLPGHLAVLDPSGGAGHNLVIDGTNTDLYYHLNFGWGGTANGWYLLPDEIPYNLTVIDGVVLDITLPLFSDGFESGDTTVWFTP